MFVSSEAKLTPLWFQKAGTGEDYFAAWVIIYFSQILDVVRYPYKRAWLSYNSCVILQGSH